MERWFMWKEQKLNVWPFFRIWTCDFLYSTLVLSCCNHGVKTLSWFSFFKTLYTLLALDSYLHRLTRVVNNWSKDLLQIILNDVSTIYTYISSISWQLYYIGWVYVVKHIPIYVKMKTNSSNILHIKIFFVSYSSKCYWKRIELFKSFK